MLRKEEFCTVLVFLLLLLVFLIYLFLQRFKMQFLLFAPFIVVCRMLFAWPKKVVRLLFLIGGHVHLYLLVFLSFLLFCTEFSFNFHSLWFFFSVYFTFDVFGFHRNSDTSYACLLYCTCSYIKNIKYIFFL